MSKLIPYNLDNIRPLNKCISAALPIPTTVCWTDFNNRYEPAFWREVNFLSIRDHACLFQWL